MAKDLRNNLFVTKVEQAKAAASVPPRSKPRVGLLVTDELARAVAECCDKVERIAKDCKEKNRKFRDIEFDLDNDKNLCLSGLVPEDEYNPTGVARVSDIFSKPRFFIDGAGSNDIVQGGLGNCWFLSALASASKLVKHSCVARDEKVGIYGFVFFKNGSWVNVIIDDLLYISVPKFEELSYPEQLLFHMDKRKYNRTARKGGKNLYFARSGTENETWVPLIEKAYAKLHGDYGSLNGGRAAEALEDLTGGVSTTIRIKDILDPDQFWEEELLKANSDRLFSASYDELDTTRSGKAQIEVEGLIGGHAYSVLKAVKVGDKRFLVVRNPWGQSEWKGPWSDGSKEWTPEWLTRLPEIGHVFGDDGQFVMEYSDFLEQFEDIDRTILFDESWKMSMEWLRVPTRPPPAAWSFGDVSFNFTIYQKTKALIVLSKLDDRYFKGIEGCYNWNLQFLVHKISDGETIFIAESDQSVSGNRSVNTEASLQPGDYIVHVRMEGLYKGPMPNSNDFNKRKLARVLAERSQSRLIASNYEARSEISHFPLSIDYLLGREKYIRRARTKLPSTGSISLASLVNGAVPEHVTEEGADGTEASGTNGPTEAKMKVTNYPQGIAREVVHLYQDGRGSNEVVNRLDEFRKGEEVDKDESESTDHASISSEPLEAENGANGEPWVGKSEDGPQPADVFVGLCIYSQGGEQVGILGTTKEEADRLYTSTTPNDTT